MLTDNYLLFSPLPLCSTCRLPSSAMSTTFQLDDTSTVPVDTILSSVARMPAEPM